jgi:hypothetical protein
MTAPDALWGLFLAKKESPPTWAGEVSGESVPQSERHSKISNDSVLLAKVELRGTSNFKPPVAFEYRYLSKRIV